MESDRKNLSLFIFIGTLLIVTACWNNVIVDKPGAASLVLFNLNDLILTHYVPG
jgi:uncharacterized membrane protein